MQNATASSDVANSMAMEMLLKGSELHFRKKNCTSNLLGAPTDESTFPPIARVEFNFPNVDVVGATLRSSFGWHENSCTSCFYMLFWHSVNQANRRYANISFDRWQRCRPNVHVVVLDIFSSVLFSENVLSFTKIPCEIEDLEIEIQLLVCWLWCEVDQFIYI
ncbi:hypothetical protein T02_7108 [Trichinella nativa]|uniref:Uncharacterized protein n=1 Tax=Trichinella nativa TaxID=6335 RepID=A0A0V1KUH5_9BILA|nr:hypothetical protein T02_7108 [Trichinella nativa]